MTEPKLARPGKNGRRYQYGDLTAPAVSTVKSAGLPAPALEYWKTDQAIEAAIENADAVRAMLAPEDATKAEREAALERAVKWVRQAARDRTRGSLDLGNAVHEYAEAMAHGQPLPMPTPETAPYFRAVNLFFEDWSPEVLYTELTVFNRTHVYAGTLDIIFRAGGRTYLADWKTTAPKKLGHGIYPDVALQCAAYRYAEFAVMDDGTAIDMPTVDEVVGINLQKGNGGQYKVVPVDAGPETFRAFLYIRQVAYWQDRAMGVLREPVGPPIREAVGG